MTQSIEATKAAGTLTIAFSTNLSKQVLLNQFNEHLAEIDTIELINSSYSTTKLEIHEHRFTDFDESTSTGVMEVDYVAEISKSQLLQEFIEAGGLVNLVDTQKVGVELEINSIVFTYFDEESDVQVD